MTEAAQQTTEPTEPTEEEQVRADIANVLKTVFDPEIPVNIYDMGLIYGIDLTKAENGSYKAHVRMTLTSPNCPAAAELPAQVQVMTETVQHVESASVEIVWDPPWTRAMMSEEATLTLGFF